MGFWEKLHSLDLQEFRPGIFSKAEMGQDLVMACMEIGAEKEDSGHEHPFEQCGLVIQGKIEMFIGDDRRVLEPMEVYFIPKGVFHGWKTFAEPVKVLDITAKSGT